MFGRISASPDRQNLMDFYFDTGIVFTGRDIGRPNDTFGIAFGYGDISSRFIERQLIDGVSITSDFEAVLEVYYTAKIMLGWTVTPDVQYIWNPGGRTENPDEPGEPVRDSIVLGVRSNISF